MYDFAAQDGQIKCDHAVCERALELSKNVAIYEAWRTLIGATPV